jgi:hypothetical protein
VAAVLTYYEASYAPGNIQLGQPYSTTGWGLWQITPGDSGNLTYGEDYQILDPWNNAEQAALKCLNAAGETYGCWTPWSTYTDPWYQEMPNPIPAPDTDLTDPGQYVPYSDYTGFAHNRSEPGSTYGPPMPNSAIADVFWKGATEDHGEDHGLFQALGPADKTLSGPNALGYGPLGSAPSAGVDGAGNAYVYWRGANKDLYEAYWDGSGWVGPVNRGMGPMGSQPGVAISSNGTAYVFWEGATANHGLFEATGPADGALYGPIPLGYGPLGSAPSAGVDSNGNVYVFWEGATADHGLFEAYYNGSAWSKNPIDQRMGPLGSQPGVAITSNGTADVFWEGATADHGLFEATGPADGALYGPIPLGYGPLGSAPTAAVDGAGNAYVFWEGATADHGLFEAYYNGSAWSKNPIDQRMGPMGSQPTVAIHS